MSLEMGLALTGAITGVISLLGFAWVLLAALPRVSQKADTMWDFQLRRAHVELLEKKMGTMNSPITVSHEARQWMAELASSLREFYRRLGRQLTDAELAIEIERRFGRQIMEQVCIPHGLWQGACLLIAMAVAREGVDAPINRAAIEATRPPDAAQDPEAVEDQG